LPSLAAQTGLGADELSKLRIEAFATYLRSAIGDDILTPEEESHVQILTRALGVDLGRGAWELPLHTLAFNPSPVDFGTQAVGTTSPPQTVTVTNTSPFDTDYVNSVSVSPSTSDFKVAPGGDGCTGSRIGPSGYCTVSVTYSPSATDDETAQLQVDIFGFPPGAFIQWDLGTSSVTFRDLASRQPT
jgi:hypothetical protein